MRPKLVICVHCAKLIEPLHRYRIVEEGLVAHQNCLDPCGAARPEIELVSERDERDHAKR